MSRNRIAAGLLAVAIGLVVPPELAIAATAPTTVMGAGSGLSNGKRHKKIDFDDELVEGMNKHPLDSLSQVSERDRDGNGRHLYRKRGGFQKETQNTLREMRYLL